MDSIEQKLSRFPQRNGFKTVYKYEGERLQVKQIREDEGTVGTFKARGWKEYNRADQPIEAKQYIKPTTAEDQIAELRKMQAQLKQAQNAEPVKEEPPKEESAEEETQKRRGRPAKQE